VIKLRFRTSLRKRWSNRYKCWWWRSRKSEWRIRRRISSSWSM